MKKLLLALPLVAGASWAGSTFYAGTQTQPAYEKLLTELNPGIAKNSGPEPLRCFYSSI